MSSTNPVYGGLHSLPNELLVHILSALSTKNLLPFTAVSHRFHNLIIRILHRRLLVAASLDEERMLFECYHPSAQYTAPRLYCDYLGTDGLNSSVEGEGSLYEEVESTGRLGKISSLYSRFHPYRPDTSRGYLLHYPGATPFLTAVPLEDGSPMRRPVTVTVALEASELFSQLVTAAHLVRDGPRGGIFHSFNTVHEGTVRIWRRWLVEQETLTAAICQDNESEESKASRVLWVDHQQRFGIRVRVTETVGLRERPILFLDDDDLAVTYDVELEGK